MSYAEIVTEIRAIHGGITRGTARMGELCKALLERSRRDGRRASADPVAAMHVVYANAWARVAGLVQQAVRRTEMADRMLDEGHRSLAEEKQREEQERRRREATEQRRAREARQEAMSPSAVTRPSGSEGEPMDDLIELYGKELVDDASR
jgi:hypothetical protein